MIFMYCKRRQIFIYFTDYSKWISIFHDQSGARKDVNNYRGIGFQQDLNLFSSLCACNDVSSIVNTSLQITFQRKHNHIALNHTSVVKS